jgi:crotonobetainyl-CoA:carnitine CoA-transferase CaiB-like acyl-CoA transferase
VSFIGRPEWIDDERMVAKLNSPDEIETEVQAVFLDWLRPLTKQEAMAQAQGWPLSAMNTPADVFRDPHMREHGLFVTVDQPGLGPLELPGLAMRFSGPGRDAPPAAAGRAQRGDLQRARLHPG